MQILGTDRIWSRSLPFTNKIWLVEWENLSQDGEMCLSESMLRGCLPLQRCKEPTLEEENRCRFDISASHLSLLQCTHLQI